MKVFVISECCRCLLSFRNDSLGGLGSSLGFEVGFETHLNFWQDRATESNHSDQKLIVSPDQLLFSNLILYDGETEV